MNNFLMGYLFGKDNGFAVLYFFLFFIIVSQISYIWNISKKDFWINLILLFVILSFSIRPAISIFAYFNPKAIQAAFHSRINPFILIPLSLFNCITSILIIINGFKMMRRTINGRILFVKTIPFYFLSYSLLFVLGVYFGMTSKPINILIPIITILILILILGGICFNIYKYYKNDNLIKIFKKA